MLYPICLLCDTFTVISAARIKGGAQGCLLASKDIGFIGRVPGMESFHVRSNLGRGIAHTSTSATFLQRGDCRTGLVGQIIVTNRN
jgi:hypothetical protein